MISLILKNYPEKKTDPGTLEVESATSTEGPPRSDDITGFVPMSDKPKDFATHVNVGRIASRGTLIICPLSTVYNWEEQIYAHTKAGSLSVIVHHGSKKSLNARHLASHDVVITTYDTIRGAGYVEVWVGCLL